MRPRAQSCVLLGRVWIPKTYIRATCALTLLREQGLNSDSNKNSLSPPPSTYLLLILKLPRRSPRILPHSKRARHSPKQSQDEHKPPVGKTRRGTDRCNGTVGGTDSDKPGTVFPICRIRTLVRCFPSAGGNACAGRSARPQHVAGVAPHVQPKCPSCRPGADSCCQRG